MSVEGDVVVLVHLKDCGACHRLLNVWSSETSKKRENVVSSLKAIDPKLTFLTAEWNDKKTKTLVPASLLALVRWFPSVFYIPKEHWNRAISDPSFVFPPSTTIFNLKWNEDLKRWDHAPEHQVTPEGFVQWLTKIKNSPVPPSEKGDPLLVLEPKHESPKKKKKKELCGKAPVTLRRR